MTLLEKLQAASSGSRELDAEIALAAGESRFRNWYDDPVTKQVDAWHVLWALEGEWEPLPRYTTSLDAIVALVEAKLPGWGWNVQRELTGAFFSYVYRIDATRPPGLQLVDIRANAPTPALALCMALLKSLEERANG